MGANSKIEWTDHTFNAWVGCTKVSPACDHCYAEAWSKRAGRPELWNGHRARTSAANWKQPLKWNALAEKAGKPARVFCCSLADVFDNQVEPEWRVDLFALIRATSWLEWQMLTKRPQNIVKMCEAAGGLPENVALGTTAENQEEADRRVPKILEAAAKFKPLYLFLSAEPLIGPVNLHPTWLPCPACKGRGYYLPTFGANFFVACEECLKWARASGLTILPSQHATPGPRIGWVICGGESGGKARPMHPSWAQSLRDQCAAAGVPFHFKQFGEWATGFTHLGSGYPVFKQFVSHQQWIDKAPGWVNGGICLDRDGRELKRGADFARARDEGKFPITIMHRVGKARAGRLLDGVEHNGMPERVG